MPKSKSLVSLIIQIVVLIALIVLAIYFISGSDWGKNSSDETNTNQDNTNSEKVVNYGASLSFVEGDVKYQGNDDEWREATSEIDLLEGYSLKTTVGKAIIALDDGSALRLNNNSQITLTSLDPKKIIIANEGGEVYSRVVIASRIFEVSVGDIAYQAVGTAYTTINTKNLKGVEVFENNVKVLEKDIEKDTVTEGKKLYQDKTDKEDLTEEDKSDEFTQWNKEKDQAKNEYKDKLGVLDQEENKEENKNTNQNQEENKEENKEQNQEQNKNTNTNIAPVVTSKILFSAKAIEGGISFGWDPQNVDTSSGFKIVKSKEANPVYPGNSYKFVSSAGQRVEFWNIQDGETYHFRICQYLGGSCGVYSNDVVVTAPSKETKQEESSVNSISLTKGQGGLVSWTVDGTSKSGFKVVWSKIATPTYPTRETDKYAYLSTPSASSHAVTAFDGPGDYFVRVCEYLGGKCGVYSNQVEISLN